MGTHISLSDLKVAFHRAVNNSRLNAKADQLLFTHCLIVMCVCVWLFKYREQFHIHLCQSVSQSVSQSSVIHAGTDIPIVFQID